MSTTTSTVAARLALPWTRVLSRTQVILAGMILAAAIGRFLLAAPKATPRYLPDEYLYPELARSLAHGDGVTIRGVTTTFWTLLEPLLIAPFWRFSTSTGLELTEAFHSLAMALAAIPVYLIARRLALSSRVALLCAALSLVSPGLLYSTYMTADALGYLLALTAVAVAVHSLARPTAANQSAFLAAAGLATFARLEYAVLLPVFLVCAVVVEHCRPVRVLRRFKVAVAASALALIGILVGGASLLGRYDAVTRFSLSSTTAHWLVSTAGLLVVAAGAALAPAAVIWGVRSMVRPTDRARSAFGAFFILLTAALIVASAVMSADTGSDRFLERYLIVAAPLVAIAFCCWWDDGRPAHIAVAVAALAVLVVAARVPISGQLAGQGSADSPFLFAWWFVGRQIGSANASLVAALVISVCALATLLTAVTKRLHLEIVLGLTLVVFACTSIGAHAADLELSSWLHEKAWSGNAAWVDETGAKDILFVQTPLSGRDLALATILWNRSITEIVSLGTDRIERFDGMRGQVRFSPYGVLVKDDGTPIRRPAVFATNGSVVVARDARRTVHDSQFTFVEPKRALQVAAVGEGVRGNESLAPVGRLWVYPRPDGTCTALTLQLTLPHGVPPSVIQFMTAEGRKTRVEVEAGKTKTLRIVSGRSMPEVVHYRTLLTAGHRPTFLTFNVAGARMSASRADACPKRRNRGLSPQLNVPIHTP